MPGAVTNRTYRAPETAPTEPKNRPQARLQTAPTGHKNRL